MPNGIVSTGWPSVQATCSAVGIEFDAWQAEMNQMILAKDAFGLYAADTVGISICRQAGKTYDVGALLFADCIREPGTLAVWTAHHFTVTRESFNALRAMAETPAMRAHIDPKQITTGAGNECIPFLNGSRIMFKARESGALRGVAKVRRLILDEGQILTERAMADIAPTMNQATNPQIIVMGTPPKPSDPADFFTALRKSALAGESEGLLWVEFGANAGDDPEAEDTLRRANPSYPHRTPRKAIERLRKLLTGPGDFEREVLGIWDVAQGVKRVIDMNAWGLCAITPEAVATQGNTAYGVRFSTDGSRFSVSVALAQAETAHVEALGVTPMGAGLTALADWLTERWRKCGAIVLDGKAGVGDLVVLLKARGVPDQRIIVAGLNEAIAANQTLVRMVTEGTLTHAGQEGLDASVAVAAKRAIGQYGGWGFEAATPDGDVSPVESTALALYGATTTKRRTLNTGQGRTMGNRAMGNRRTGGNRG